MQRSAWRGVVISLCVSLSGCGANNQTSDEASTDASALQSPAAVRSGQSRPIEGKTSDPAQTVRKFLTAVQAADDDRLNDTIALDRAG